MPAVKAMIHGMTVKPPADPPAITYRPWNNLILTTEATPAASGAQFTTSAALAPIIRAQLSIPASTGSEYEIEWQLLELHVWGMLPYAAPIAGQTASNQIIVLFMDLQGGDPGYQNTGAVLSSQIDDASGAQRARVGFRWPSATQTDVFWLGSDYRRLVVWEGPVVRFHWKIRWRMRGYSAGTPTVLAKLIGVSPGEQEVQEASLGEHKTTEDSDRPKGGKHHHMLPPASAVEASLTSTRQ